MANAYGAALATDTPPSAAPAASSGLPAGIGNDQQASQATAFIRQQPWYLDWVKSQGLTPGADGQVKLNDTQRAQLMALALQHGIGLNHKYDSIDENGQIAEEHHKLKKVAIAAAIAGLAVTGLGAAGIGPLAGALGGGSAIAGAAPVTASMTGLGTGAGALVPATVSSLAGGAAAGGATAAGIAGATGTAAALAPLATTAIPGGAVGLGITPATAGMGGLIPAATSSLATTSAVAPVVTNAATGGIKSWLTGNSAGLITQGISAAGNIYATKKQADAAEEAARLQNEQYDKALAVAKEEQTYNRNQYGDYLNRLAPYAQTGAASNDRLSQFMGQPPAARAPAPPLAPGGSNPLAPAPATPTLVKMQGPDGSVRDIPADQVPKWTTMGAKVLQSSPQGA